ncbi:MAG: DUF2118 domain-containing protein [Desulfurococcaceae archaeon]
MSSYIFPEVYVENVESTRYLCIMGNEESIVTENREKPISCARRYGIIPYEQVINYIDLVSSKTTKSIALLHANLSNNTYSGFIVENNSDICIQEVKGGYIYVFVREGEIIERNADIAYVVTNKLEIRNIKSLCTGLLALIIDIPWDKPRRTILVSVSEYRSINARKNP